MIHKIISVLKIGPKVNLVLDHTETETGEKISGTFHISGGLVKQKLSRLECDFIKEHAGGKAEVIEPVKTVLISRMIDTNDRDQIPFTYQLPKDLNPTSDQITYRFRTKLVFNYDSKSMDHDEIIVNK
ncbi:sporulation protein [Aquibacillus koreensis]|uniref:Sporulation protein n=1 Tax=Aquibacillus koreensis TaxID=279446 RepID=A0A9X3WHE6_9BACI|nr:sporulation protein [Aquibacillus koreensis]MCT2537050.1 sporulation protein [Aquibacillus koreensis]MDC3419967.1 sporulation protein [Aquibacillus koreensis]